MEMTDETWHLIKGAYARSRVRQMILGGRTRHIIGNTEIPVFLSH